MTDYNLIGNEWIIVNLIVFRISIGVFKRCNRREKKYFYIHFIFWFVFMHNSDINKSTHPNTTSFPLILYNNSSFFKSKTFLTLHREKLRKSTSTSLPIFFSKLPFLNKCYTRIVVFLNLNFCVIKIDQYLEKGY